MKLSQLVVVVTAACSWAGCSGEPGAGVPEPPQIGTVAEDLTSSCQSKTDGSGPFQEFTTSLTRRIRRPNVPDKVLTIGVVQTERWLSDSVKEENLSVNLNGQPLFQNLIDRYSFTDEIDIRQNYYAPYQGVSSATGVILGGSTMYSYIDGRFTLPAAVDTPASAVQYEDGLPGPTVTVDPDVLSTMNSVLSSTKTAASKCIASDTTLPPTDVIPAPDPSPHPSDTRNNASCQFCRGGCAVLAGACFYGAATSIACGPFVFFCAAVEIAGCTASEIFCLKLCDGNGAPCCAVGCGGEGNANFFGPPGPGKSVGCCTSGEQCLNRSNGLCCSQGTTPCGGTDCCASGESCVSNGSGGQMCCNAGSVGCGGACCPSGQFCGTVDNFPTCCSACTTNAQCPTGGSGSVYECVRGCCVNIPG
jgi:hypothetical protein